MRADRLLSALLLLRAHGRLTGRQLAKRLEVSGRRLGLGPRLDVLAPASLRARVTAEAAAAVERSRAGSSE